MKPTYAVETVELVKEYSGKKVVNGLNLRVERGELFGFLGPNGAGKTTTIRVLTTLTRPTSGKAFICGNDLGRQALAAKAMFGIVQQHMSLNRDLTVRENLELHARLHHLSKADRKGRIDELLRYVELEEHSDHLIEELSGGLKRRAMIARALIHRPELLILDEPTVGLDAQARRRVWDLIRRMNAQGSTIFLTTHYIEEAEALCDRVGIIHHGRLIAIGAPLALRRQLGLIAVEVQGNAIDNCNSNGNYDGNGNGNGNGNSGGTKYRYFSDRISASDYVQGLTNKEKVTMRESNLEDVFIELTGQKVLDR